MSVTITCMHNSAATRLPNSKGKLADRLAFSCFPEGSDRYWFRCEIPRESEMSHLLMEENPEPQTRGCCRRRLPRFAEVVLTVDGQARRVLLNINSVAKRIEKPAAEVFQACVEGKIVPYLEQIALPIKWKSILRPSQNKKMENVVPFLQENWAAWKAKCDGKLVPSLFFQRKDFDIEYFADGSIFIYYADEGKNYAVDLSQRIINPELRQINAIQRFHVYQLVAGTGQEGIVRVYRASAYPEQNIFNVLLERYKNTLQDFFPDHRKSVSGSLKGSKGSSIKMSMGTGRMTTQFLLPWSKHKVACQLLQGLAFLENKKIVHLSIQPTSISVEPGQEARAAIGNLEYAQVFDEKTVGQLFPTDLKMENLPKDIKMSQGKIAMPQDPFAFAVYCLGRCFVRLFEIKKLMHIEKKWEDMTSDERIQEVVYHMNRSEPHKRATAAKALRMMLDIDVTSDLDLDRKLNFSRSGSPEVSVISNSPTPSISTPPPYIEPSTNSSSPSNMEEQKYDPHEVDSKNG